MAETLPIADLKTRLPELLDRIEKTHERIVLTRDGRPVAVLMSSDDLESLEETLAILSDGELMESIQESRADIARGRFITGEEFRLKYLEA